ncbi:arsenical resistance operon transcriptional repressor ArsD [Yersinia kristensenii]|uniref:arsenic metallochaperone ArsD family protein n=1 Tax=Yersinia kristensenii TaxID=28152 RepID=UPI000C1598AB|nr:arsenic metallochaperone ArsD family protein [Yersinia kristensenii]NIL08900.1 arsenic metallochaperone ArsD family protein [Yersinia kristensenii]PJE85869.1 arsenical resistance operon transcriptional repressor ArsD [Yersinia kristensenii]PJG63296.1 arsenical resistance operon transcriptional repressor ArsD [Yersinia kristensenii]QKJ17289.1 arsenic metallochaperone ArsD family protein [Yersinia kristensenii]
MKTLTVFDPAMCCSTGVCRQTQTDRRLIFNVYRAVMLLCQEVLCYWQAQFSS